MDSHDVDIAPILENRRIGRFQALTLFFGVLTLFVDGLDYSAINVGAPAIIRGFHAETSAMGFVFGWSFFGIFVGSVLFGYIGDKFGRKIGTVFGVLAYSLPAIVTVFATSLDQLTFYRFLAGVGIGGVVPNIIALLTETAPKRYRVTFVMVAFIGYSTGNASIAQVAAWLVPAHGWQIIFLVAGVAGVVLSGLLAFALPESIPYLAGKGSDPARLSRLVKRAAPELMLGPDQRIVIKRPANESKFSLKLLFGSYRRYATPLLWLAFFAESLTFMTLSAWLAVLLESAGLTARQAALTFSFGSFGAVVATIITGLLIDRLGPKAAVVSALLAVTMITYLGSGGLSPLVITVVAVLSLACASATHQSINGIVGGFYPTLIRGNGVGYATGMGRIAAIIGPIIVSYLMAANLPRQQVLLFIAAPDLIVAAACVGLDVLRRSPSAVADFAIGAQTPSPSEQPA
jgi:AAHS family 4-hydroxybenzoate transporter-like MFS transporter